MHRQGDDMFGESRVRYGRGGKQSPIVVGLCGVAFMISGCITDATTDLTKAPFDATTELTDATSGSVGRLTDGTSQASTDLTEPTREFLSSTTPGAWFHADGTVNKEHAVVAFMVLNYDNLQANIAQGQGEYLMSLATLTGNSSHSYAQFCEALQRHYGYIFEEGQAPAESVRRLVVDVSTLSIHS